MNRPLLIVFTIVALALTAVGGYWLGMRHNALSAVNTPASLPARKALYWYDPMVPDQHFDKPGKSPFMDMMLVPRYADETGAAGAALVISPRTEQNLGMRTAQVRVARLTRELNAPATITWDLSRAVTVSARPDAIVDRLDVRVPYAAVRAGQPLAELLAPDWSAAVAEYRALGSARSADARALRTAAREHLRQLGLDPADLRGNGAGSRIVLRAPITGVVSELDTREGQRVNAGDTLLRINGLDTVWLDAAIPQANIEGIAAGTPVRITVSALPGRTFTGRIDALLPEIDQKTRSQRARIVLDNPQHLLAPGMFADVRIDVASDVAHPLIPDEALIATGRATRVIVAEGGGRFRPIAVRTGLSSGGMTEILSGLSGDERVVVSGQFLIDSEASLSGALDRLGAGTKPDAAGRALPGMGRPPGAALLPSRADDAPRKENAP